jgi:hypothetical protein
MPSAHLRQTVLLRLTGQGTDRAPQPALRGRSRASRGAPRSPASLQAPAPSTRYERNWAAEPDEDGALVAALIQAARRSLAPPGAARPVADTFAAVIAPLLVAFVEHVLADCAARGIAQVVFLARDGQLMFHIAERIVAQRRLPLTLGYVLGSRHALHLAGYTDVASAASWLLEDTQRLSLADIALRGDMPIALMTEVAHDFGYTDLHADLPHAERLRLPALIRDPRIHAALQLAAERAWSATHAYYRAAGFVPGVRLALVDVGWSGRMQRSLRAILARAGTEPAHVTGHYLCLATRAPLGPFDSLEGYLHDPARDSGPCPFDGYRALIEAALAADHGTTLGFALADGTPRALLGAPPPDDLLATIRLQQATVLAFVDHMLAHERASGRPVRVPKAVVAKHLRWMLEAPELPDARAFAGRTHCDGQADSLETPLARRLPDLRQLLRRSQLGLWPEGTFRLSGAGVLLGALRVFRQLKSRVDPWRAQLRGFRTRGLRLHAPNAR